MSTEQLPLFPGDETQTAGRPQDSRLARPTARTPLSVGMERFGKHMEQQDYAENTIKSFLGDLGILKRFLGGDPPIGRIGTNKLKGFLQWLLHERGKPCSPKSYARRLTTLKVFFSWLYASGGLPNDPAASLHHRPVQTPMPRFLTDQQVDRVLTTTREMMAGGPDQKTDPRPHLLVCLVLNTGIKKQECMAIKLSHLEAGGPDGPVLQVRYDKPRMLYKERRLRLPDDWPQTLANYQKVYEPQQSLFPCTSRNLEYVLANVAKQAGLEGGMSFEMLRWTCALRDYKGGMAHDRLRRKLGLSKMSWKETQPKLSRLAEPPL